MFCDGPRLYSRSSRGQGPPSDLGDHPENEGVLEGTLSLTRYSHSLLDLKLTTCILTFRTTTSKSYSNYSLKTQPAVRLKHIYLVSCTQLLGDIRFR